MKKFMSVPLTLASAWMVAIPAIAHADPFQGGGWFFNFWPFGGFGGFGASGHAGGAICGAPAPSLAAGVSSFVIIGGAFMTSRFFKRSRAKDAA